MKAPVEVRLTARVVEIFHKGERIASHVRTSGPHHSTCPEHMPSSHRAYSGWTTERAIAAASRIGPATAKLTSLIIHGRRHPEQGLRTCRGILGLAKRYGADRLEAACNYGLSIDARSYPSIKSILQNELDRRSEPRAPRDDRPIDHTNIRGARYYH